MPGLDPRYSPPEGAVFDPDHPLAQGMVCCLLPNGAGGVVDVCRDRSSGLGTAGASTYGPHARDWTVPAARLADLQFNSGRFSVASLFRLSTGTIPNSEFPRIVGEGTYTNESTNAGWALGIYPPDNGTAPNKYVFETRNNSATSLSLTAGGTPAAGDHMTVGTMGASSDTVLYLDGVSVATSGGSRAVSTSTGALQNASSASVQVPTYISYAWSGRTLAARDVIWLANEPFVTFRMPVARTIFLMTAEAATAPRLAPTGSCHPMRWPSGAGTY